jgi:hypothetical protein
MARTNSAIEAAESARSKMPDLPYSLGLVKGFVIYKEQDIATFWTTQPLSRFLSLG